MFKKLVNMIKDALRKFVSYDDIDSTLDEDTLVLISEEMQDKIDLWRDAYKDVPPWYSPSDGVYTLSIPKAICQLLQLTVLSEMNTNIVTPGEAPSTDDTNQDYAKAKTRADYLNLIYKQKLIRKLPQMLEKGMAMGGMIIKPYITSDTPYFDFVMQGDFLPLEFDDDGNITDIIFVDQFISNGNQYTKLERQIFKDSQVTIINKAFMAHAVQENDDDDVQQLGVEIPLSKVPRWSTITEEPVVIENVNKPLYGYYKVPIANNVDMNSPLGISVFSPALKLIERADTQFSRLDWEYNGGQIAIDVDASAVNPTDGGYYGSAIQMDSVTSRLYRRLDLGQEDTYKAFAPQLRDTSYDAGLNSYLHRIEDLCGLARGTLANDPAEARTATEVSIVKQRSYVTASSNQDALGDAIRDAIYALNVYTDLYNLAPEGEYSLNIEWQDNILTDTQTELEQKLNLNERV
jgi:Phage portal protein, SPP1 Gp6-like.